MLQSRSLVFPLMLGVTATGLTTQAGMDAWGERKNRVGFNGRAAFNIQAEFENLGGIAPQTAIGPAVGGVDHFYDDGYNRVDSNGNANSTTWYWGYDRATQVQGDLIGMSSTSVPSSASLEADDQDPQWGGEVVYARELGWNAQYWWGLVVGVGMYDLSFKESQTFGSSALRTTDFYSVPDSAALPPAPYRGGFNDSTGPVIGDVPTRQSVVLPNAANTSGTYEFDGSAYTFRLGLLFETPFNDRLDLQFGGGVIGSVVDGTFRVSELTSLVDVGQSPAAGESTDSGFVGGGYGEVNLSLRVAKNLHAYVGGQYMYMSQYVQTAVNKQVTIQFENVIAASIGLTWTF